MTTRLRWAFADGLTLVGREVGHLRRAPGQLVGSLIFPALLVLMFGYVFGSAIAVPGGGNYREYLMPGLFVMVTVTGVMATTMVVATDAGRGVLDRFKAMPVARSAVPLGWTGADILIGLFSTFTMVVCGLIVGWRPHNGVAATLAAFGLLTLMRYALSWAGVFLGLVVRDEETADRIMPLVFPVTMVSNTFVPTEGMPAWLRTLSEWNPVSALVAACRQLFGNPRPAGTDLAWPLAHPIPATLLWSVVLLVIFVPLAVRAYRRKSR
ncbi:ABC transporter permease [Actinophytocola sp.]|uniref:ABC transporter permease n=1 Tax=Actinophytocola sp. TaxID=1872138 RepID=UPI002D7FAFAD|nr:ABC transporter permease [Actinophytocola sp.]HET9142747.1 ABC transporter permease [Actinophytocola sp.]